MNSFYNYPKEQGLSLFVFDDVVRKHNQMPIIKFNETPIDILSIGVFYL